ncbi:TetR/AcrR family transcriptional regulator [Oxalobacteraceae bacterium A2-2]
MAQQASARERILDTAKRLFYRDGLRATGIDKIIAESGVAKMSLYRHFASKDDLIAAFLEWRHGYWMEWFAGTVERRMDRSPTLAVLADALGEWFEQEDYRGCAFINTAAETGSGDDPRHLKQAIAHKQELEAYITTLAIWLGLHTPEAAAQETMLCVEGMIVRAQMQRDPEVIATGRRLLARIEQAYR